MTAPSLAGKRILVVDDEATVRQVVAAYLDREGFEVAQAADGTVALEMIEHDLPDLVVLDVMLPGTDGLSILNAMRREMSTPVILLTARADATDRVLGLEMGADDYVVKPFSPREVVARVKAVLKRGLEPRKTTPVVDFGQLVIDGITREVAVFDVPIELTAREFDLLYFLASSPRQVFSRNQLLEHVWDSTQDWQDPATVTVHIGRLRQKLEPDPRSPKWITTVWGVGYRFEP